jgi:hypothetical protein
MQQNAGDNLLFLKQIVVFCRKTTKSGGFA